MIPTWGAAFGANAIFNSAEYRVDLTHSAIPDKAAPGTTASFTRATTKTWPNNDGYLVTGLAGEIDFPGTRRGRNLLPSTEGAFSGSGWTQAGSIAVTSGVSDPLGGVTAYTLTQNGATSAELYTTTAPTCPTPIGSVWIRRRTGTGGVRLYAGAFYKDITTSLTSSWQQLKTLATDTGTSNVGFEIRLFTNGDAVDFWHPMLEDRTSTTDKTTPSEYVSVGVPSDWAGTELVTNGTFDTDTTGWTAAEIFAVALPTLAVSSGKLRITNTGATYGCAHQTFTTVIGAKYVFSVDFTLGTCTSGFVRIGSTGFPTFNLASVPTWSASGTYSVEFTATTTATTITIYNLNNAGGYNEFDNVSVKPAYYHGSFVDGVKCFPTDLSGNPLTTMERYKPELAATNVLFKSNTLNDAAWTQVGTPAPTQNVIGVDGATSAWTLTDNDAGNSEYLRQNGKLLTAATWTLSCYVAKTTGAQASYPAIAAINDAGTQIAVCTVDTTNGVATAWTAYTGLTVQTTTARCRSYNSTKWLVELAFTATAANWGAYLLPAITTNATQSTGIFDTAAQGSAVFERVQLELGSAATSYIDNTSAVAAVTRNADVLTYSGGDIANLKTLVSSSTVSNIGAGVARIIAGLSNGTTGVYTVHFIGSGDLDTAEGATGGSQWIMQGTARTANSLTKIASSWATNDVKGSKNGVALTQDTTATMPVVDRLEVGHLAGTLQLNGNVGGIYGWTRNLSQSGVNAVTA